MAAKKTHLDKETHSCPHCGGTGLETYRAAIPMSPLVTEMAKRMFLVDDLLRDLEIEERRWVFFWFVDRFMPVGLQISPKQKDTV